MAHIENRSSNILLSWRVGIKINRPVRSSCSCMNNANCFEHFHALNSAGTLVAALCVEYCTRLALALIRLVSFDGLPSVSYRSYDRSYHKSSPYNNSLERPCRSFRFDGSKRPPFGIISINKYIYILCTWEVAFYSSLFSCLVVLRAGSAPASFSTFRVWCRPFGC